MSNIISVSFPADNKEAAKHLGAALIALGGGGLVVLEGTLNAKTGGVIEPGDEVTVSGTTTGDDGTATVSKVDTGAAGGDEQPAQVDTKKVPFNAKFCGKAAKPFYASGPRDGQWKKRQGVDDAAYDAWYAEEMARANLRFAQTNGVDDEPVDTSSAFGNEPPVQTEPAPTDCGAFMGWVSAKQAAGLLTQEDIGAAYPALGLQVTDLFPPNDEATVAGHVTKLHQFLSAKVGA
jgi:hypothetical protein